jgi:hypothetical protein
VQPVPAGKVKSRKSTEYSARELFDIVQTAIKVKIFAAKYGQKGVWEHGSRTEFYWSSDYPGIGSGLVIDVTVEAERQALPSVIPDQERIFRCYNS